jgi:hypothetical protein
MEKRKRKIMKQASRRNRFKDMMSVKYIAIRSVLAMNRRVVWSDIDAMWLRPCAWSYLLQAPPYFDIVAQRGLSPTVVSDMVGVTVCTGFMMIRPTDQAKSLIDLVLYHAVNGRLGDQFPMNLALFKFGGFSQGGSKLAYKSSSFSIDIANPNANYNRGDSNNITIGLLPYREFPRGLERDLHLNGTDEHDQEAEDDSSGREWTALAKGACIWHRQAEKRGISKVAAMRRDGVLVIDPQRIAEMSDSEIQKILYTAPTATK